MDEQILSFNKLVSGASSYLEHQLSYSLSSINYHKCSWRKVKSFMYEREIIHYDRSVEEQIILYQFNGRTRKEFSNKEKHFHTSIKILTEFQETGKISISPRVNKRTFVFEGAVGKIMDEFIRYKRDVARLSTIRIHCYQRSLSRFLDYCNKNSINCVRNIDLQVILQFIEEVSRSKETPVIVIISTLRGFMGYVFLKKLSQVDISRKIPRYKTVIQPKIPSTYSKQEIETLISSIERSSAIGKRNYAIVVIAARLGLRASDICKLKFENLHWDISEIRIRQYKTGKELALPLLPDVGNAIIDYLRYGRPQSEEPYVFLTERPPYRHFTTSNVVTHVVQRAFKNTGIDINGRRFGSHSLRHSLGFRMLQESTILPVISEVLGHEDTESTRYYLRIDLKSMQQCMLDVPPVETCFYVQKGGMFYE
ncbi:MAG: site-specific integrase [Dysgonamonadaceae bacterium]|jgi:integrase|nr:site-specific integrase [Dysgonamonadaceae bacterium]